MDVALADKGVTCVALHPGEAAAATRLACAARGAGRAESSADPRCTLRPWVLPLLPIPGVVKTDANPHGVISPEESAAGLLQGAPAVIGIHHGSPLQRAVCPPSQPCWLTLTTPLLLSSLDDASAVLDSGKDLHGRFYSHTAQELPW